MLGKDWRIRALIRQNAVDGKKSQRERHGGQAVYFTANVAFCPYSAIGVFTDLFQLAGTQLISPFDFHRPHSTVKDAGNINLASGLDIVCGI